MAKVPDTPTQETLSASRDQRRSASRPIITVQGASWKMEYTRLTETLESRGYQPNIARRHTKWVRKFQAFTRSKAPGLLSSEDVRGFLHSLGNSRNVASKQYQAYDALLVFFRHVLEKEVGVERPKRANALTTNDGKANATNDAERRISSRHRTGKGASWATEYAELKQVIQVLHYSPKTLQRYTEWVRRF